MLTKYQWRKYDVIYVQISETLKIIQLEWLCECLLVHLCQLYDHTTWPGMSQIHTGSSHDPPTSIAKVRWCITDVRNVDYFGAPKFCGPDTLPLIHLVTISQALMQAWHMFHDNIYPVSVTANWSKLELLNWNVPAIHRPHLSHKFNHTWTQYSPVYKLNTFHTNK